MNNTPNSRFSGRPSLRAWLLNASGTLPFSVERYLIGGIADLILRDSNLLLATSPDDARASYLVISGGLKCRRETVDSRMRETGENSARWSKGSSDSVLPWIIYQPTREARSPQ